MGRLGGLFWPSWGPKSLKTYGFFIFLFPSPFSDEHWSWRPRKPKLAKILCFYNRIWPPRAAPGTHLGPSLGTRGAQKRPFAKTLCFTRFSGICLFHCSLVVRKLFLRAAKRKLPKILCFYNRILPRPDRGTAQRWCFGGPNCSLSDVIVLLAGRRGLIFGKMCADVCDAKSSGGGA